ncbi:MAG: peptidylprolyl isomerase [Planctomycetia bacterium]|nr:peptidylprolyl isomerase [Planctomycetia bacterium]
MAGVSAFGSNHFAAAEKCFNYAKQTKTPLSRQATAYADSITEYYTKEWARELQLRQRDAQANNLPQVLIRTSVGDMVVELFEKEAPNTVANFITLVEAGYYNGLIFHRVLPGFMAQGGCPKGDGTGGPGYNIPEEYTKDGARYHFRGSLAMARSMDPDSAGSQFYITFLPNQSLDKNYTVFGHVIEGMATLSNIERIDPERPYPGQTPSKIIEMKVLRKQNTDYSKFKKM